MQSALQGDNTYLFTNAIRVYRGEDIFFMSAEKKTRQQFEDNLKYNFLYICEYMDFFVGQSQSHN